MTRPHERRDGATALLPMLLFFAVTACGAQAPRGQASDAIGFAWTPWSEPVSLGPAFVNAQAPALSRDGETLYFASSRGGTQDIWVSHVRKDGTWGPPARLPEPVNGPSNDGGPFVTRDGRYLFFGSNRAGTQDIYVSTRSDADDDLAWSEPVAMGPEVNTGAFEANAAFLSIGDGGRGELYFSRGPAGPSQDFWVVPLAEGGEILGPASRVDALSSSYSEAKITLRRDGREAFFWSTRPDVAGDPPVPGDLFVSTRGHPDDPWTLPRRLPAPPNGAGVQAHPALSFDARTMIFVVGTPGTADTELFVTTRMPLDEGVDLGD